MSMVLTTMVLLLHLLLSRPLRLSAHHLGEGTTMIETFTTLILGVDMSTRLSTHHCVTPWVDRLRPSLVMFYLCHQCCLLKASR